MSARFQLGQLLITPGARDALDDQDVSNALRRHSTGDWGEVCQEDSQANDWSVDNDARLLSAYRTESGVRFWIITEADRAATTVLLPEEY